MPREIQEVRRHGGPRFDASPEDAKVIQQIARRAVKTARETLIGTKTHGFDPDLLDDVDWMMTITACHRSGCPLRLRDLLLADDFNFSHDVFGIRRHLDKGTGELGGCFVPRFAAPERA